MGVDESREFGDVLPGRGLPKGCPAVRRPGFGGDHLQRLTQPEALPVGRSSSASEAEVQLAVAPLPGQFDRPVAVAPLDGVLGDTVDRESVIGQEREPIPDPVLKVGSGSSLAVSHRYSRSRRSRICAAGAFGRSKLAKIVHMAGAPGTSML